MIVLKVRIIMPWFSFRIRLGLTCQKDANEAGSCKTAARAVIEVCGGICREYYPQIRYFIRDLLKYYPKLTVSTVEDQTGEQPFVEFFDSVLIFIYVSDIEYH